VPLDEGSNAHGQKLTPTKTNFSILTSINRQKNL
jgi:hypothetical protein